MNCSFGFLVRPEKILRKIPGASSDNGWTEKSGSSSVPPTWKVMAKMPSSFPPARISRRRGICAIGFERACSGEITPTRSISSVASSTVPSTFTVKSAPSAVASPRTIRSSRNSNGTLTLSKANPPSLAAVAASSRSPSSRIDWKVPSPRMRTSRMRATPTRSTPGSGSRRARKRSLPPVAPANSPAVVSSAPPSCEITSISAGALPDFA